MCSSCGWNPFAANPEKKEKTLIQLRLRAEAADKAGLKSTAKSWRDTIRQVEQAGQPA